MRPVTADAVGRDANAGIPRTAVARAGTILYSPARIYGQLYAQVVKAGASIVGGLFGTTTKLHAGDESRCVQLEAMEAASGDGAGAQRTRTKGRNQGSKARWNPSARASVEDAAVRQMSS